MDIQQIREMRKRLGQSQWALAVRVGRSGTWLSLRESGYVEASLEELKALSAALRLVEAHPTDRRKERTDVCRG